MITLLIIFVVFCSIGFPIIVFIVGLCCTGKGYPVGTPFEMHTESWYDKPPVQPYVPDSHISEPPAPKQPSMVDQAIIYEIVDTIWKG